MSEDCSKEKKIQNVLNMVALFFVGVLIGMMMEQSIMQHEAIKHGVAEYNSVTGRWQWKDAEKLK